MEDAIRTTLKNLLRDQPTAALATMDDFGPLATLVLFAAAADFSAFYMQLSGLALHSRKLAQDGRASLLVVNSVGVADPQQWPRISITGTATALAAGSEAFDVGRETYLAKHPQANSNFRLGDFRLWNLKPGNCRFVAGFGRIYDLGPEALARAAA